MGILIKLLPVILLALIVLVIVKLVQHYNSKVKPQMEKERAERETLETQLSAALAGFKGLNRRWLRMENDESTKLEAPSATDFNIPETAKFFKARRQFVDRWDGLDATTMNDDDKRRFIKNFSELDNYFTDYVKSVIERDNPSRRFIAEVLPSTENYLS